MKLGGASRHLVGGVGWSLRMIAKSVGVSTASGERTPETVKAQEALDDGCELSQGG